MDFLRDILKLPEIQMLLKLEAVCIGDASMASCHCAIAPQNYLTLAILNIYLHFSPLFKSDRFPAFYRNAMLVILYEILARPTIEICFFVF